MEDKKEFMTAEEVAKELNVSRSTLQRLIVKGTIKPTNEPNPFISKPKAFKFNRSDVEALIKNPPKKKK
jgi:predicted site-specific integrase-resolvase